MNKHRKAMLWTAALVLMLVLSACGKEKADAPTNNAATPPAQNKTTPNEPAHNDKDQNTVKTLKGTGEYVGQADTTSVEITVNGEPKVFQLGGDTESVLAELEPNDPVEFEYVEEPIEGDNTVKQLTLTKLQKAGSGAEGTGAAGGQSGELPQTKQLNVTLEGNQEQRTAKLAQGDGFAIYVPEGFSFDSKAGKLTLDADPDYFATVTKLPSDYKLDYLALEADQELSDVGRVKTLKGDAIAEPMRDAKLFMLGDGSKRTKEYIVKEIGGQGYVFRLEIPVGEAAEGFGPLAFASLNSVVTLVK
ncbi:hypothetical protein DCC85_16485 [Paenibacillus sp. CAA11]|uniref:hypothetical protein n=1 Tax=Paenibacillus sp. CAA11 TaxID=1532905 RepID=UPI000D3C0B79|nr:hypothetical protein [Paenibacillus sp. CAA11]AWB45636.1 hypothetical protein DCC85_16485 [Paenibacillus sp. CAA11]